MNKRRMALVVTLIISMGMVFTGTNTARGQLFHLGVKAGLNKTTVSDKSHDYWDTITGYHGGAFLTYTFLDSAQIRAEVNYTTKGSQINRDGVTGYFTANYREYALLAGLVPSDNANLLVLIGPAFSQFTGGKYDFSTNYGGPISESGKFAQDDLRQWDTSIIFGIEHNYKHLLVDVRYAMGLSEVFNYESYPDPVVEFHLNHRGLQFGIGIQY